jgi:hypothetical protein
MNFINFFTDINTDLSALSKHKDTQEIRDERIHSAALRIIGILGTLASSAALFIGVSLSASSPISAIVVLALGAVDFALSHDMIRIGINRRPPSIAIEQSIAETPTLRERAQRLIFPTKEVIPGKHNETPHELKNTWIVKSAYHLIFGKEKNIE